MTTHAIYFMRPIVPETLAGFQNCALNALVNGATKITVYISSEGGNNDQGFAMYHFIRSLPATVSTHCIGNVESMAIIAFLAGERRLVTPEAKIKIHPMHWGFAAGSVDHDRLAEFVDSLDFDASRYTKIYEERTKGAREPALVKEHLGGRAKLLTAHQAVAAGIATDVVEAKLPANVHRWWV